jgi:hypothetical protein
LITPAAINKFFVKCAFSNDYVSSNNDSTAKLSEDEEDDWHRLQPLRVLFEQYTTYCSSSEVSEIHNVNRVLDNT